MESQFDAVTVGKRIRVRDERKLKLGMTLERLHTASHKTGCDYANRKYSGTSSEFCFHIHIP